jgi:outer membrane lipoprotein carrier protein
VTRASAALLCFSASVAAAQPAKTTPAETLANVAAAYKKPQHFRAKFKQTVTYALTGKPTVSTGDVYLSKPDKLRFDYFKDKKADKHFIFDGKTLWVVEHEKTQIIKQSAKGSALPAAMGFFTNAGSLAKDFTITAAPSDKLVPGAIVLALSPKQPSAQYKELYFVVDPTSWLVTRTTVVNSSGDSNTIEFSDVTNKDVAARTYQFDPKTLPKYSVKVP